MMSELVDPRVHAGERIYDGEPTHWRPDGTCSYCGSRRVPEVVRLLRTPGTYFSGTDKTAYKAYVGNHHKFYFRHLRACTDADLLEFDALSRKVFGLAWRHLPEGDVGCRFPKTEGFYGWQTWGVIGPDGEPVFDKDAPKPPDAEWWAKQGL